MDRSQSVSFDRIAGSYDQTRGGLERAVAAPPGPAPPSRWDPNGC